MEKSPVRGKYRTVKFWRDPDGREVFGLKRRPHPDNRFYAAKEPTRTFGTDPVDAIRRFRAWESGQLGAPVWFERPGEYLVRTNGYPANPKPQKINFDPIPEATVWAKFRDMLLADPPIAAQKLGIPEISRLETLPALGPSSILKALGDRYQEHVTGEEVRKVKLHWREFTRSVGVDTVRELSELHLSQYADALRSKYRRGDVSWHYVKHRFSHVKSVFGFAKHRFPDKAEIGRVLTWASEILNPPKHRSTSKPRPIERADLERILKLCEPRLKAAILFALNTAAYPVDISRLRRDEITKRANQNGYVYVANRAKTGILRVAVLWERTIEAIRAYHAAEPHGLDLVFARADERPWRPEAIRRMFCNRRDRAGVSDSVKFDSMRDSTKTRAIEGGARNEHTRLILGHRLHGQDDDYLARNPEMVAEACAAVERFYFG